MVKPLQITKIMCTFAERITKIFEDYGKTQNEFARHVGISEKTFRNYRDGVTLPSIPELALISKAFNVNCDWLVMGEGPQYRDQPTPSTNVNDTSVNILGFQRKSQSSGDVNAQLIELLSQMQRTIDSLREQNAKLVERLVRP